MRVHDCVRARARALTFISVATQAYSVNEQNTNIGITYKTDSNVSYCGVLHFQ